MTVEELSKILRNHYEVHGAESAADLLRRFERFVATPVGENQVWAVQPPDDSVFFGLDWWERRQADITEERRSPFVVPADRVNVWLTLTHEMVEIVTPRMHRPEWAIGRWQGRAGRSWVLQADGAVVGEEYPDGTTWSVHVQGTPRLHLSVPSPGARTDSYPVERRRGELEAVDVYTQARLRRVG